MKKRLSLFVVMLFVGSLVAQNTTLTFTGRDTSNHFIPLNRVVISNLTRDWQETIDYPDTILVMNSVGIEEYLQNDKVQLFQNIPNPFVGVTDFSLQLNKCQKVLLEIYDVNGTLVAQYENKLPQGQHLFRAMLATPQTYLLSAKTASNRLHIKMANIADGGANSIEYLGQGSISYELKSADKGNASNPFELGDRMKYVGYATFGGTEIESDSIVKNQNGDETISLTFTLPLPTVTTANVSSITVNSAVAGGEVTTDGGAAVTSRGVCWSTNPTPTIADSHTEDGAGTGSFTSSMTGLSSNTTYYVRAYATNSVGTSYGEQMSFSTIASFTCGTSTITDYDNITYNTVQLGNQCWMKENLRTTHYSDGTPIALGSSTSTTVAYRYYPNNYNTNVSTYGYLYNWKAVMRNSSSTEANPSGVQGICPTGWHVPSDAEWNQLVSYISSQSQYRCNSFSSNIAKALASTSGWSSSTTTCAVGNTPSNNNATGFAAMPAGSHGGSSGDFGSSAFYWSATQSNSSYAYYRGLNNNSAMVTRSNYSKSIGYSVRCLKN